MITGIVMASGFSRRMGENKLLIDINGDSLIERVLEAASKSKLDRIIIIYRDTEVKKIADKLNVEAIFNKDANLGQSESMKLGIENTNEYSDYMFLVGDQPFLTSEIIDRIIERFYQNKEGILVPHYEGKRGMPTIFPNKYRKELLDTKGDKGGRDLINNNIDHVIKFDILDSKIGMDIDTREDLLSYKALGD